MQYMFIHSEQILIESQDFSLQSNKVVFYACRPNFILSEMSGNEVKNQWLWVGKFRLFFQEPYQSIVKS